MSNFIMGFLLGKRCSKPSLKPSKETLNHHEQVLNYVEKNPLSSCGDISSNLNLFCPDVNASLIKLWREGKLQRTEDKRYFIWLFIKFLL